MTRPILTRVKDILRRERTRQASAGYPLKIRWHRLEAIDHAIKAVEMGMEERPAPEHRARIVRLPCGR